MIGCRETLLEDEEAVWLAACYVVSWYFLGIMAVGSDRVDLDSRM